MKQALFLSAGLLFFSLACAQAPENDLCSDAIDLTEHLGQPIGSVQSAGSFSNIGATGEAELEAELALSWFDTGLDGTEVSVDQSVWFHFTGDGNVYQFMTWNCPGSAFYSNNTQMAIYQGSCDDLDLIVANDDLNAFWDINYGWHYSFVNAKLEEGQDYFIMVDGYRFSEGDFWEGVAQGTFCLSINQVIDMGPHNSCEGAKAIDEIFEPNGGELSVVGPFDNTVWGSGVEPGPLGIGVECWNDGPTEDGSVWFTFEGDGNSYSITNTFCNDENVAYLWGWDTQTVLYKGGCDEMVPVDCGEDLNEELFQWWGPVGVDTEEGETYHLRVDGFHWEFLGLEWTASGAFCLQAYPGNLNGIPVLEKLELDVFPNPSSDGAVRLQWSGEESLADVGVFDISGRQVGMIMNVTRGEEIHLDVPNGTYVLSLKTDAGHSTVQVQIIR
ncbi:MAG: hypothetical protein CL849_04165 [Crocinitomicaceae bacterium]|nr:hypothetical protein [Crocinitomicaceae bacterium]